MAQRVSLRDKKKGEGHGYTNTATVNNDVHKKVERVSKALSNTDVIYEQFNELPKPFDPMCNACKKSTIRGVKDAMINMLTTINMVIAELPIGQADISTWEKKCKFLRRWARAQGIIREKKIKAKGGK